MSITRAHGVRMVAFAGLAACSTGFAQDVFNRATDTGWVVYEPPPLVGSGFSTYRRLGGALNPDYEPAFGTNFFAAGGSPSRGVVRSALSGGAQNFEHNTLDEFEYSMTFRREFDMLEPGRVYLPTLLNEALSFSGTGGSALVTGSVGGLANLFRQTSPGVYGGSLLTTGSVDTVTGADNGPLGNGVITFNHTWDGSSALVPAGHYLAEATLRIRGTAGLAGAQIPVGAIITADATRRQTRGGFFTSFATIAEGLGDSRAAVRAPAARSFFGVTGSGVTVSVLETGETYTNHASLDASRVVRSDGGASGTGDPRDEHALAVASLIGARSTSTAEAGIAPDVRIRSVAMNTYPETGDGVIAAFREATALADIVNMSAGADALTRRVVDARVVDRPRMTFVNAVDNGGVTIQNGELVGQAENINTATDPSRSFNIITVGALSRDFTQRARFSSFNGAPGGTGTPSLVAPGEQLLAASLLGSTGNSAASGFARVYTGNDFDHIGSSHSGPISGTSFAAPLVAGTVALMHNYRANAGALFDDDSIDHRVMKSILINSATTEGIFRTNRDGARGPAWSQETNAPSEGLATETNPLIVSRSLDPQLGGGALNTFAALRTFAAGEVNRSDGNTTGQFTIDARANVTGDAMLGASGYDHSTTMFWDLETVGAGGGTSATPGVVDYLLGDIIGGHLRCTLTWDITGPAANNLVPLNLRLFMEGADHDNAEGLDDGDILIAQTITMNLSENVKMLDLVIPDQGQGASRFFFLEVANSSTFATEFGLAVQVPLPGTAGVLSIAGALLLRRRRGGLNA